eukprot:CFRG6652T1
MNVKWNHIGMAVLMAVIMVFTLSTLDRKLSEEGMGMKTSDIGVSQMKEVEQQLSRFMEEARLEQDKLREHISVLEEVVEKEKTIDIESQKVLDNIATANAKNNDDIQRLEKVVDGLQSHMDYELRAINEEFGEKIATIGEGNRVGKVQSAWSDARDQVRDITKWAWDKYVKFAWGQNEIRPSSGRADNSLYRGISMGATIIDSLDTLLIMGLTDEYEMARKWIAEELHFDHDMQVSTFETAIRVLGGLLSAHGLTHDTMYIAKCTDIADRLIKAIRIQNGKFVSMGRMVHLTKGTTSGMATIAEFGTLQLEFEYLSDLTGDSKYRNLALTIRDTLNEKKTDNFYGANFNGNNRRPFTGKVTMGGEVDSFYEYLLKGWILGGRVDETQEKMYYDMADSFMNYNWVNKTSVQGFSYFRSNASLYDMEHLACFAGGMYALGAQYARVGRNLERYMDVATELTRTCHQGYINTPTGLAPEAWRMNPKTGNPEQVAQQSTYILRPETMESYVYMWRYTKQPKYREWGQMYINSLNAHAKVNHGYDSLHNVWGLNHEMKDNTPSFFFAETLKYLYLLYSDDDIISFDDYVFNTEAHPLPILGQPSRSTPRYPGLVPQIMPPGRHQPVLPFVRDPSEQT